MSVKLHFHGAARTVTGSCYLIETEQAKVLVDCGMFQGSRSMNQLNYRPFPFDVGTVHALVLTHAHIDHTGVVPKLTRHGFKNKIHCTNGTADLCAIMLPDSGHIQEMEVKQLNVRSARKGKPEVEPMYTLLDAMAALEQFEPHPYKEWFSPAAGIRMRFWNAGHLLGSSSIETEIEQEGGKPIRLLFSGDIGPDNMMLEPDPEGPTDWDYVVCESTYGGYDRFERSQDKRRELLAAELTEAAKRNGVLLIPSFAVERTQEVVTDIVMLMEQGRVPQAPLFIDSPLAGKATQIFRKHSTELENGSDLARAFNSPLVKTTESVEDSKALNRFTGFFIVVSASGMAEAGRIRHHLRNNLWKTSTTVLFVGYQAVGTLGAELKSGVSSVRIMGEDVKVAATIRSVEDYSGHADGPELVQWLQERKPIARNVFITHGEEERQINLARDAKDKIIAEDRIIRPALDEAYEISGPIARLVEQASQDMPRLEHALVAKPDWDNDYQGLLREVQETLDQAAGDKQRGVILRRLRRALSEDGTPPLPPPNIQRRRPGRRGFDEG
ncbi:MBL fold metallo-hydrolase [Aestuariivirga litoralis]|uniref:MBL fold metallo-hydrolase n=1 Tax=Aestuariivirga litoralis TaxID=2650924 RepID=UPI0018C7D1B7|nr:MBL fold metallo-hydrolase [Aestuariivirga litoralis]MBG1233559.1 MBL fold metallo-hydrolase [Aestuariivirga litoralis]